jgi:enamidase
LRIARPAARIVAVHANFREGDMAAEAAGGPFKGQLVVRNIGLLLSGDLAQPILDADTIVAVDGRIAAIGKAKDVDTGAANMVVDAKGGAVAPGLIDSHCHPVFGDWTPRQNQLGWIESCVNGGVTTFVSAGEVHLPGRPKDPIGVKALAITAQRTFANFRPAGAKIIAGAPIPEKTMDEADYAEMAKAGVSMIGEIGLGTVNTGPEAKKHVAWCRKHGLQTIIHTGGPSIPGSNLISHEVVLEADPDVISHINGGHTALAPGHICQLCEQAKGAIEIVHNGNEKAAIVALKSAIELKRTHEVIIGTDAPAGSGVQPLGVLRTVAFLASFGGVAPEIVFCMATGNTARIRKLDAGLIAVGKPADFVFLDKAQHTSGKTLLESVALGDLPGNGMVMIDGNVSCGRSRNTPPADRIPEVVGH